MDDMHQVVLDYVIEEYLEDEDEELGLDTPLISGGIVDSFSMVSLKRFLETKYNISIPDDQAETIATVGQAIAYLEENVK